MEKKECKLRTWCNRNKDAIKRGLVNMLWYCVGFGVGGFACSKLSEYLMGLGVMNLADKGVIKLFDPDSGLEISVEENISEH